jgi:hypothetical protein
VSLDWVRTKEEIAEGTAQEVGDPALRQMMRAVVDQMTALAQAAQVGGPIVARIVIEMGGGEHDTGVPYPGCLDDIGPVRRAPALITPSMFIGIKPAAVGKTADGFAVRPTAFLAQAARPLEPHMAAELRPVDRIEPAHLSSDRHCHPCS